MCGIAGFIDGQIGKEQGLGVLENMLEAISHRGPDARGKWHENNVFLGQNRLSIIDLSESANQPFHYQDIVIVYNGEVYNYIEVKADLESKGYRFTTSSDTEVICAAYKEYGERCVEYFMGMWAFAIWDKTEQKLFCSRDRFGIKPFYYIQKNDKFYFGSEYKALKPSPVFSNQINVEQVQRGIGLNLVSYQAETFFIDIQSLEPSHNLVIRANEFRKYRYYDIDLEAKRNIPFTQQVDEFHDLFRQSIIQHSRSDVATGACLSGGLDSSSIVSMFATLFPSQPIKTFSIFYDGKGEVDERPFIKEVVNKYKTVTPFYFSPSDAEIEDTFDKVVYHSDVPLFGSSFISQHFLMKLAKENGVTVAIDGQGADEYLGGYLHSFYRLFATQLSSFQLSSFSKTFIHHLKRENYGLGDAMKIFSKSIASMIFDENEIYKLEYNQSSNYFKSSSLFDIDKKSNNRLDDFLYHLLFETTLQTLLHFEDRNSMAYSIESRVPFLDHRLVEYVFGLHMNSKINTNAETKFILRESMKNILPKAIYERKDKKGFVTPGEVKWLDGPLRFLLDRPLNHIDFMKSSAVKSLFEEYKKGNKSHAKLVWKLACLNYWLERQ